MKTNLSLWRILPVLCAFVLSSAAFAAEKKMDQNTEQVLSAVRTKTAEVKDAKSREVLVQALDKLMNTAAWRAEFTAAVKRRVENEYSGDVKGLVEAVNKNLTTNTLKMAADEIRSPDKNKKGPEKLPWPFSLNPKMEK